MATPLTSMLVAWSNLVRWRLIRSSSGDTVIVRVKRLRLCTIETVCVDIATPIAVIIRSVGKRQNTRVLECHYIQQLVEWVHGSIGHYLSADSHRCHGCKLTFRMYRPLLDTTHFHALSKELGLYQWV